VTEMREKRERHMRRKKKELLSEKQRRLWVFLCKRRWYQECFMSFGIVNVLSIFMRLMNQILHAFYRHTYGNLFWWYLGL
jgi:hypothetical protein